MYNQKTVSSKKALKVRLAPVLAAAIKVKRIETGQVVRFKR